MDPKATRVLDVPPAGHLLHDAVARVDAVLGGDDPGVDVPGRAVLQVRVRPDQVERRREVHTRLAGGDGEHQIRRELRQHGDLAERSLARRGVAESVRVRRRGVRHRGGDDEHLLPVDEHRGGEGTRHPDARRRYDLTRGHEAVRDRSREGVGGVRRRRADAAVPRGRRGVRERGGVRDIRHRHGGGDSADRLDRLPRESLRGTERGVHPGFFSAEVDERAVRYPVRGDPAPLVDRGVRGDGKKYYLLMDKALKY
mmetsp:Transcript_10720/g.38802  ORF Transcript_10720/g.38802 Transcript_10720/m.38802 type:complete len:255 (-) Transcript_10720:29-793(-)